MTASGCCISHSGAQGENSTPDCSDPQVDLLLKCSARQVLFVKIEVSVCVFKYTKQLMNVKSMTIKEPSTCIKRYPKQSVNDL